MHNSRSLSRLLSLFFHAKLSVSRCGNAQSQRPAWSVKEGVDGIKTGYTEASGYNLVASVRRHEKYIVAVVLGGASHAKRDARMRELIARYVPMAVTGRTQIYVRKPRFEQEVQPGDANIGNM